MRQVESRKNPMTSKTSKERLWEWRTQKAFPVGVHPWSPWIRLKQTGEKLPSLITVPEQRNEYRFSDDGGKTWQDYKTR